MTTTPNPSVEDCPFCNAPNRVVRDNALAQVVLSNPHKVPGHLLVMPKRHIEQPWDLTNDELAAIFELIFFVEQRLVPTLGDGVDIRQNYRPFKEATDLKANHVLFHVLPRSDNDYLYQVSEQYEKDLFADLDDLERQEVERLLK